MEEKLSQILRSKSGFDVFGGAAADAGRSKVKGGVNIVEAPLSKGKSTVSLSAFAFLYSEILQRVEKETRNYEEYREKLSNLGKHVGLRILELYAYREVGSRRENSELGILQFISKTVWKVLFNKPPGELLKSEEGCRDLLICQT